MTQQTTDFREGDLVEAIKGESVVVDRLVQSRIFPSTDRVDLYLPSMEGRPYVPAMIDRGWTLALLDRPAPKVELPTEPGAIVLISAGEGRRRWLGWRSNEGDWDVIDPRGDYHKAHPDPITLVGDWQERLDGIEVLEPSAVTAKKVIAAVRKAYHTDDPTYWGNLDRIAREFGVTE